MHAAFSRRCSTKRTKQMRKLFRSSHPHAYGTASPCSRPAGNCSGGTGGWNTRNAPGVQAACPILNAHGKWTQQWLGVYAKKHLGFKWNVASKFRFSSQTEPYFHGNQARHAHAHAHAHARTHARTHPHTHTHTHAPKLRTHTRSRQEHDRRTPECACMPGTLSKPAHCDFEGCSHWLTRSRKAKRHGAGSSNVQLGELWAVSS